MNFNIEEDEPLELIKGVTKRCGHCKIIKPINSFYKKKLTSTSNLCIECVSIDCRGRREKKKMNNCGSDRVPHQPNVYADKYQKECTFFVLESLGYTFNEENGIWWKPNWKTQTGEFPHIVKGSKRKDKRLKVTDDIKKNILYLRKKGYTYEKISKIVGISDTTISKILNNYKDEEG